MFKKYSIQFLVLFFFLSALLVFLYSREIQKISNYEINSWTDDIKADCGVVLTGGPGRVREGFDLLAQGRIRKLIISGVYPQADLLDIFPQKPFYGSIQDSDIVLEKRSGTTYGNAQQTLPLVEALNCRDMILVTSGLHMYRSKRIFLSVFPKSIPIFPVAIIAGRSDLDWDEILVESTKSIFYSLWAY